MLAEEGVASMNGLDPGLAEVALEVAVLEGHVRAAERRVLESPPGGLGQGSPVDHPEVAARAGLELKLVVPGEVGHVFDLEAAAVAHLRAGRLLVAAVARSSSTEDTRVRVGRCVGSQLLSSLGYQSRGEEVTDGYQSRQQRSPSRDGVHRWHHRRRSGPWACTRST